MSLAVDQSEVEGGLRLLVVPGETFEIRALATDRDRDVVLSGYFDDPGMASRQVVKHDSIGVHGWYVTLNPVDKALRARRADRIARVPGKGSTTADQHIVKRTRLLIDADAVRPSGISATDAEHEAALAVISRIADELRAEGWAEGMSCDSGNGGHLDFAIDLPADDDGLVARVLAAAQARWGCIVDGITIKIDVANANPARITKLYGTPARKGDNVSERPHRLSRVLVAPEELQIVTREQLETFANRYAPAPEAKEKKRAPGPTRNKGARTRPAFDVAAWLDRHGIEVRNSGPWSGKHGDGTLYELATCPYSPDHGERGEAHVEQLASGAISAGCPHDTCKAAGWDWSWLKAKYEPRREIVISKDIAANVDEAEAGLLDLGSVYVRARTLVHVVRDKSETRGLKYPDGQPVIARLGGDRLHEIVNGAATWIAIKTDKKTGDRERVEVMAPNYISRTLGDRGEWSLPALDGVTDAPALRVDGSILEAPGYDVATRLIYDPAGVEYPCIPAKPTRADAVRALDSLLKPFNEFPFKEKSDRTALAALILTLIARPAIDGPTPMFAVRATTPGSGKGLAIDCAAMIATGRSAPKRPAVANDDELRKAFTAYALEAPPLVLLDNAEGAIGSPVLAALLTTDTISDRMLGLNESRTARVRFVLAVTGNNLSFRGDLGRRVVPIDLDPRCENPEDRTFEQSRLLEYVHTERPRLVVAALTVLRAFFVAGRPAHGEAPKGSYEAWDALVRGAIRFAGGTDPLAGVKRIRADGDEDLDRLRALHNAWSEAFGSAATTIGEAIKKAGKEGALHDALAAFCRSGTPEAKPIAGVFRRLRGRIVAGREIVKDGDDSHAGVVRWCVRLVGA